MLQVRVELAGRPGWLSLKFPWNPGLLAVIKALPQREWKPEDDKAWWVAANRITVQSLIGVAAQWHISEEASDLWKLHGGPTNAQAPAHENTREFLDSGAPTLAAKKPLPAGFVQFSLPFAKQREALEYAYANNHFYLSMEVGTGKTKVFLDRCRLAAFDLKRTVRVLLVGPNNKVPDYYKKELPKHAGARGEDWECFDARGSQGAWDKAIKALQRTTLPKVGLLVVVLNWESLARRAAKLQPGFFDVFVVDEMHCAKNPQSQQGKIAVKLAKSCAYLIGGSGTPCPQGPFDLWNQIQMLNATLLPSSYTAFRSRYAIQQLVEMNGNRFMEVLGYQNLTELRDIFARVSFRAKQHECFDLPPVVKERRYVTLDPATSAVYESIRKDGLAMLGRDRKGVDQVSLPANAGAAILRARQLCGGFIGLTDLEGRTLGREAPAPGNNKLKYLVEELAPELMLALADRQVLVWAVFRPEIIALVDALRQLEVTLPDGKKHRLRVASLWGDTPKEERATLTERFERREIDWLISNPQSGGTGMEFQTADVEIWYSRDYNLKHREQGEGRIRRYGQKRSMTSIDLLYEGTVEEPILEAVEAKRDLQKLLTNDPKRTLNEVFAGGF